MAGEGAAGCWAWVEIQAPLRVTARNNPENRMDRAAIRFRRQGAKGIVFLKHNNRLTCIVPFTLSQLGTPSNAEGGNLLLAPSYWIMQVAGEGLMAVEVVA